MRLQVNDTELFFETFGSHLVQRNNTLIEKQTIIMIHGGLGLDHSLWRELAFALSDDFYCIAIDLRNNGRSAKSPIELCTVEIISQDLTVFCRQLGIRDPILLGSSVGANLCLAVTHAVNANSAVLISAFEYDVDFLAARFTQLAGEYAGHIAQKYFSQPTPEILNEYMKECFPLYSQGPIPEDLIERIVLNPEMLLTSFPRLADSTDLSKLLPDVPCPCFFIEGLADPLLNIESRRALLEANPKHSLTIIEDAGHFSVITHMKEIEKVLRTIRETHCVTS